MSEKTPGQLFWEAMYASEGGVWVGVDERHRPIWEAKAQAFIDAWNTRAPDTSPRVDVAEMQNIIVGLIRAHVIPIRYPGDPPDYWTLYGEDDAAQAILALTQPARQDDRATGT